MRTRTARLVTPIALILCWLLAGGIGGPFFGKVSEVAHNVQKKATDVSAVSEEQAASTEEIAAASHTLAELAEKLQAGVQKFRL